MTLKEIIERGVVGKTCTGPFEVSDKQFTYMNVKGEMLIESIKEYIGYKQERMYLLKGKINDKGEFHNKKAQKSVGLHNDLGIISKEEMWKRRMQAIKDHFESEEGKQGVKDFHAKLEAGQNIESEQVKRIHRIYGNNIDSFIEKVIAAYESKGYKDKWYSRGIEPPTDLYWVLLRYAKRYGEKINRKTNRDLLGTYVNPFTSEIYKIGNYVIQSMNGQGSVVRIDKIK